MLKQEWDRRIQLVWDIRASDNFPERINNANDYYRHVVKNYFLPGYMLYWDSGEVTGDKYPIPPGELGL